VSLSLDVGCSTFDVRSSMFPPDLPPYRPTAVPPNRRLSHHLDRGGFHLDVVRAPPACRTLQIHTGHRPLYTAREALEIPRRSLASLVPGGDTPSHYHGGTVERTPDEIKRGTCLLFEFDSSGLAIIVHSPPPQKHL
jgi:hypothetical protein